jgi:hypothetical protein
MIPRKLHIIWIGNQKEFPEECVTTWRQHHPDWDLTVWRNDALSNFGWICSDQMQQLLNHDIRGVVDCMRWEILHREGGVVLDADMFSLRPLPEWLLEYQVAAPWLNEIAFPGTISTAFVAAEPKNPLIAEIIFHIQTDRNLSTKPIHDATGAGRLLELRNKFAYRALTLLPSHFFLPRLPNNDSFDGTAPVYAYKKFYTAMGSRAVNFHSYLTNFKPSRSETDNCDFFFTVGIANYNREDYLYSAIRSVLDQDYSRFELLIVDDGSTDNSQEVVLSFNDPRIRFVKKLHSGIPRTFNRILEEARGSHIVWLGNDDLLIPGLLSKYALLLQNWPEVVFSYGDLIRIDSHGEEIHKIPYPEFFGDKLLLSRFLLENVVPAPGSMANLGVMRAIGGFDNDIPYSNDYDLWVRLAATGLPFKHIGQVTCKYRWHGSNISNHTEGLSADDLKILHKMLSSYDLTQICADLNWLENPQKAESLACDRIFDLLTQKKDDIAAEYWLKRKKYLQLA